MSFMTPHDHSGSNTSESKHHHHHHGHGHHHHDHSTAHNRSYKAMLLAFGLNLTFAFIELGGGIWANSVAVISDAIHDFGDALALAMALVLERLSTRAADQNYSYGYRRWSLVSALWTGGILIAGTVWIWIECISRLRNPEPVNHQIMLGLAFFGILVNGFSWYKMSRGSSVNEEMLSWHFIEDLMGWVAVLVVATALFFVDWPWLDSVLAMAISLWISYNVGRRFLKVGSLFLQKTPEGLQIGVLETWIKSVAGVSDIHHTHVWSVDGQDHILTSHIILNSAGWEKMTQVKSQIKVGLKEKFNIIEATLEFESLNESCENPKH